MPIPNSKKPTLGLAKAMENEVVEAYIQPTEPDPEEFVSVAALASQGREALLDKMREHMAKSKKEEVEIVPTERQKTQTEREMERGRQVSEAHAAKAALMLQPKPEKSEGYTTPVYRPADHVPGFNSKDPAARNLK